MVVERLLDPYVEVAVHLSGIQPGNCAAAL
jgi:hypothetical protein